MERTTADLAKEIAGIVYDKIRAAEKFGEKVHIRWGDRLLQNIDPLAFGRTYPTVRDYLRGRRHGDIERGDDGSVVWRDTGRVHNGIPNWMCFYEMARDLHVQMLTNPNVSEYMKDKIYHAIIEDREKQFAQQRHGIKPAAIPQRKTIEGVTNG
jgi:hypothetical protein